jgi:prevent-host-death family protein
MKERHVLKKINALKARQNLGQLLEEVYYSGDQYVIERAGKPMAAIVPVWQAEEREAQRQRFFAIVENIWEKNKKVDPQKVEADVAQAVRAVRHKEVRRLHR